MLWSYMVDDGVEPLRGVGGGMYSGLCRSIVGSFRIIMGLSVGGL